jgi:hypothetical protein
MSCCQTAETKEDPIDEATYEKLRNQRNQIGHFYEKGAFVPTVGTAHQRHQRNVNFLD